MSRNSASVQSARRVFTDISEHILGLEGRVLGLESQVLGRVLRRVVAAGAGV